MTRVLRKWSNYVGRTSHVNISFNFGMADNGVNISIKIFFFSFKFGCIMWHVESQFPDQGSNPWPLYWKLGVLTSGLPGKSLEFFIFFFFYRIVFCRIFKHSLTPGTIFYVPLFSSPHTMPRVIISKYLLNEVVILNVGLQELNYGLSFYYQFCSCISHQHKNPLSSYQGQLDDNISSKYLLNE